MDWNALVSRYSHLHPQGQAVKLGASRVTLYTVAPSCLDGATLDELRQDFDAAPVEALADALHLCAHHPDEVRAHLQATDLYLKQSADVINGRQASHRAKETYAKHRAELEYVFSGR